MTVWRALNWEFTITLLDRPTLRLKDTAILSRHRGGNASNPLNDRQYRFGKAREKKGLDRLFTSLNVGNYDFSIGPEWSICNWINFEHGQYFYVPKKHGLLEAFVYIFEHPIVPLSPPLTREEIDRMISYLLDDLKTKTVVRKIIAAGMDADAALGIG